MAHVSGRRNGSRLRVSSLASRFSLLLIPYLALRRERISDFVNSSRICCPSSPWPTKSLVSQSLTPTAANQSGVPRSAKRCVPTHFCPIALFELLTLVPVMSRCQNGCVFYYWSPLARLTRRVIGKLCIEVKPSDKIAFISEFLCIGCGICVKKCALVYMIVLSLVSDLIILIMPLHNRCPFEAISIINLPTNLDSQVTHRYTANSFKLHRLPTPRPGQVLGLVGTNGIGKSTALKILAGKLKPNLGRYDVC